MVKTAALICLGALVLLAACAPNAVPAVTPGSTAAPEMTPTLPTVEPSSSPTGSAPPSPATPAETELYPAAVQAARATAARDLGVPETSVAVVSFTPVDWRNGCLEVDRMERPCTDAIVPGYQVILSVEGSHYEYRTNLDGSQVVFAGPDA